MFTQWEYTAIADGRVPVMPDGCLDVLIVEQKPCPSEDIKTRSWIGNSVRHCGQTRCAYNGSGRRTAFTGSVQTDSESNVLFRSLRLTDWDYSARLVDQFEGQKTVGFRLRPGITLDLKKIEGVEPTIDSVGQLILEELNKCLEMCQVIDELCVSNTSLQQVARRCGVSVRTLQRRFNTEGLPSPDYWRRLSRVRNAALSLLSDVSIVDIAGDQGFSDQAHMTREFVQWFAVTPSRLSRNHDLLTDICQPGLGNWTTEQISIR